MEVRWDEFVRNADIREMLCQPSVPLNLRKARMKWFGNVERMEVREAAETNHAGRDTRKKASRTTANQMERSAAMRPGGEWFESRGNCHRSSGP